MSAAATPLLANLMQLRDEMAAHGKALPVPDVLVRDVTAEGVPMRLYQPVRDHDEQISGWPLLIFLHGGGWVLGDLDTHDACCRLIADRADCAVLAVGYRLAPEHPFPAGLDDIAVAWGWAQSNAASLGCDPACVAVGGESAGANLAAALTLRLRDAGEAQPLFQLLVHPPTDLELKQPSIDAVGLPGLTRDFLAACVAAYVGDVSPADPLASPLHSPDLSGLPPAIIVTVENDPLRDDGEHYALALARAGVDVRVQRLPELPHGFMFLPVTEPLVAAAYDLIAKRVAGYFGAA